MTMKQRQRLADKLHRLAYELEHDSARLRRAGNAHAGAVQRLAQDAGKIARGIGSDRDE